MAWRWIAALMGVSLLLLGACSSDSDDDAGDGDAETTTSTADDTATTDDATTTTGEATDETSGAAITEVSDGVYEIAWDDLAAPAFFTFDDSNAADPFWHIHNDPDADGFFLSLEMFTVYGDAWTGETGTFEMTCTETGTGICIHFDPDGDGPAGDLNADFAATGMITINQLDDSGYELVLSDVAFSDGTTIPGPTEMSG